MGFCWGSHQQWQDTSVECGRQETSRVRGHGQDCSGTEPRGQSVERVRGPRRSSRGEGSWGANRPSCVCCSPVGSGCRFCSASWLMPDLHCAGARATYFLRVVNPEATLDYATLLDISPNLCDCVAKQCATLPLVPGGLGLRSAVRTRLLAHWASWADCLPMIKARHPEVAASMVEGLQRVDTTECLRAVARAAEELSRLPGFVLPSWEALANVARSPVREPDQHEPGCQRAGWQHEGSARLEEAFRESLFVTMTDSERALVRSQGGPGAGAAYSACPTCSITRIDPHLFRTLLLRRLRLPLPLSKRTCRCGRPLDSRGHHRAACARAGAGEERLRCRECCCQDLPRRGSKSGDEHDGPRHGLGCAEPE